MIAIFWAILMPPGTATAFVDRRGTVRVAVSHEVARMIGLVPGESYGYKPIRRKVANVPDVLKLHVELAISGRYTDPDHHPLADVDLRDSAA